MDVFVVMNEVGIIDSIWGSRDESVNRAETVAESIVTTEYPGGEYSSMSISSTTPHFHTVSYFDNYSKHKGEITIEAHEVYGSSFVDLINVNR